MGWREDFDDKERLAFFIKYGTGRAAGIAQFAMDRGMDALTDKQLYVLRKYGPNRCLCGNHEVEDDELLALWVNEGYCHGCANRMQEN